MNLASVSISLALLGSLLGAPASASAYAADKASALGVQPTASALKKFDQALDRAESLQLPLNKVYLYRQAAVALAPTDKPRAVSLLKRALADIDAGEVTMKAGKTLDEATLQQMEFHRLPVIMLMERIDPREALAVLAPPQTADRDTAFQALFFQRLNDPELVREAALHKLDYGVTPAVVSAYEVLQKRSPETAKTLATAIVLKLSKLSKSDAENDPAAVQSAFALLRLLRTDVGSLAPAMILNPNLLSAESTRDLFSFIGEAFLSSKDPEMLILGEKPSVYLAALKEYAPAKAQDVKLLPFAAPDAKSLIFSPEKPVVDANHPDPATLTAAQTQERAAQRAQVEAQMKDTDAQTKLLAAKLKEPSLTQKERDNTLYAIVEQANKSLALARSAATALDREAFRDGEVEFYNLGAVTHVVDTVSNVLQEYATDSPKVAEQAARALDGNEVQTEVGLQIAIREMTGGPAYLVPPAKPPVRSAQPVSAGQSSAPSR